MGVEALADMKMCKSEQFQYGVKRTMAAQVAGFG